MKTNRQPCVLFFILFLAGLSAGCVAGGPTMVADKFGAGGGPYYTAANIWHERPEMWSTNYKKGRIIPAGTQVSSLKLMQGRTTYVEFTVQSTGATYRVHLITKHNPGLTGEALLDRLFTHRDLDRLTQGFSESEMKAVRRGRIELGMSRAAVLVSWGYPPEIRTPALDAPKWTYWESRLDSMELTFDEQGRLENILD